MGDLQFWLQGFPDKRRPRVAVWLGNLLSDARYWLWVWRTIRGEHEHEED